jgi:hypothetical protein
MTDERTDDLHSTASSTKEKMLFENILNDFQVDPKMDSPVGRSLSDYYFDIIETFKLESLVVGKVFNNARTVILFDAVNEAGQKFDIYYHKGNVRRISDFSRELKKWRSAFLDVSDLRDRIHREMIQNTSQLKTAVENISPEDRHELLLVRKIDEVLAIATDSLIIEYGE